MDTGLRRYDEKEAENYPADLIVQPRELLR
jgi:hypothetical protein